MSELILQVQPVTQPLIYFWRVTAAQAAWERISDEFKIPIIGPVSYTHLTLPTIYSV